MTDLTPEQRDEWAALAKQWPHTAVFTGWPVTALLAENAELRAALEAAQADALHSRLREEMWNVSEQRLRDGITALDDQACDALVAARQGKYDGLTAEWHVEKLIATIRSLNPTERGTET